MLRSGSDYRHVIEFWFGELPMHPDGLADRYKLWYGVDAATDTLIRDRFGTMVAERFDAECRAAFGDFPAALASFAREHRDIVARFGRFPHRNEASGRESTAEELAYLAGDAPSYGQAVAED